MKMANWLCVVSSNVCYVNDDGTLNRNDCDYSNGVRQFWWKPRASKLRAERRITPSKEHITIPQG